MRLDEVSADVRRTLGSVSVPSYVLDREGTIRWLNDAAIDLVGDKRGERLTAVVAPEHSLRAREQFARKLLGAEVTDFSVALVRPDGARVEYEFSSVPLLAGDHVVGVFGVAHPAAASDVTAAPAPGLTPRQQEVLELLAAGASTDEMARDLGISKETVRNHVRGVLRGLGARSRLEAIAEARRIGAI
jgi:DNA-binding CsgD family transcriptional regulator